MENNPFIRMGEYAIEFIVSHPIECFGIFSLGCTLTYFALTWFHKKLDEI